MQSPSAASSGPGSAIIIAYLMFTSWGVILGLGLGWLIWA